MKELKNIKLPPIEPTHSLSFLKQGHDKEFENALATIGNMYDDIFKSDTDFNSIFENLKPIDEMIVEIFDPKDVRDSKEYQKLSAQEAQRYKMEQNGLPQRDEDEQSQLIMGEPVYMNVKGHWNCKL